MKTVPRLHYSIQGSGPTVVLLHGYLLSSQYWQRLTSLLAQDYRVIAFDLLGFGHSPKPRCSRYDYEAHLASITATLDDIGVTEPFTLVGHSMGSLLSLRFAGRYPERVKRLFLANMPVWLSKREAKHDIFGRRIFYRLGLTPGTHYLVWALFRFMAHSQLLPRAVAAELSDRVNYLFESSAAARLRSFRNVILSAKVEADLRAVAVKTVLLNGLQDRTRYIQNLAQFTLADNIRSRSVEGNHHLPDLQPELLRQLLHDAHPA